MNDTKYYLDVLTADIHSVICATVDAEGRPVTRAMDIMLSDDQTFYFLTAKGKAFYQQLIEKPYISLTGMSGGEGMDRTEASLHKKAVTVRGKVRCIGSAKLDEIFEANPYMAKIYPTVASREALVVFSLESGEGEFFDLSTKPITRASFAVGDMADGAKIEPAMPYTISDACVGCGRCLAVCPQDCIDHTSVPYQIDQRHCLHCGNCFTDCPHDAVIRH